ncbi:MAG: hypothetical protein IH840_11570 [Candidatus Heimdallarchaeota archaeon]|nr:hypothetical protein [Candidatus Heimdallarchaeota archaeon]
MGQELLKLFESTIILVQEQADHFDPAWLVLAYRLAGEPKKAYDFAKLYLSKYRSGYLFLQFILATLDLGLISEAKQLQIELSNFTKENDDDERASESTIQVSSILKFMSANTPSVLVDITKLSEALILKTGKRLKLTIKAQTLLTEILSKGEEVWYQIRIEAMRNLCEILIQEYELYDDPEILVEAQTLVDALLNIATSQNLLRIKFEVGILRSKLILLQGNIKHSKTLIEEMLADAQQRDLIHFVSRLKSELAFIEVNFQNWIELVNSDQSLKTLIEQSNIKNYLTMVKQYATEFDRD